MRGQDRRYRAALFDLDGVIVDTARFHYKAWKEIAALYGKEFTVKQNERLKGVSRKDSLDILLEECGICVSKEEKGALLERKNLIYQRLLEMLEETDLLPGVSDFLNALRGRGVRIALGSASKNAPYIMRKLGLTDRFDVIIDGNQIAHSKPHPEVFLLGSGKLSVPPKECVVFEDSAAGIQAALAGGMGTVGIGNREDLPGAERVVPDLKGWRHLMDFFEKGN